MTESAAEANEAIEAAVITETSGRKKWVIIFRMEMLDLKEVGS